MKLRKVINKQRERRGFRVRKKLHGTAQCPRLSVHRTLKHFYCQAIDDDSGKTLFSASTTGKGFEQGGGNCQAAAEVGRLIGQKAKAAGVAQACMDRGSAKYHGRLAAFADAAREAGLQI
ncbi:MAG: 50S ribosomal protein L18 [Pirellulaceae bacterium]|nr:50S ribosomal protein L18 [Pirellulaceae bacterium]